MADDAKRERVEQILGELAGLSLMLARDLATHARAADDVAQKVALVEAFQKTSRATRLTLALDAKLVRQAARDAAEAAKDAKVQAAEACLQESRAAQAAMAEVAAPSPAESQKRRAKAVLNRPVWNESEGDGEEYDILIEDLDARLDEAARAPGFPDLPIEVRAHQVAADMRLSGELVVTTAARFAPANSPPPPQADTG